jgi:hypothetical protein
LIRLLRVLLMAFARDRVALMLTLAAPLAFFALVGSFYRHLESDRGVLVRVALVDASGTGDGKRLATALRSSTRPPLSIVDGSTSDADGRGEVALIRIGSGFAREGGSIDVESQVPFPGGKEMLRQLVDRAWSAEFGSTAAHQVRVTERPGLLVRDAASGVSVVFMMFAVSSLVARGLSDDVAGFGLRLRALGVGDLAVASARCAAMAAIGLAQVAATFALAAAAFGVVPERPLALLAISAAGAFAVAAFYSLAAAICGRRTRFVAVAPVLTLALAGLSGALIPRLVLPEAVARVGAALFPSWIIDASRLAVEGQFDLHRFVGLLAVGVLSILATAILMRRGLPA